MQALLGGSVGIMSYASVTALVPGPDAHKRPDNPLDRADTTGQSNVLFWAALVPALRRSPPSSSVKTRQPRTALARRPDRHGNRHPPRLVLGRVAINRLTAKGPELLFLLRTGRSNRPGTATRPRVQAKPEVSRRDAVISLLSWIFGSLTFFPQGLVPLIFLIVGAG